MTNEIHMCPRRPTSSVYKLPEHDVWERTRWGKNGIVSWPEQFGEPPRTCSFCGGVHVEDALKLIEEHKFEVSITSKFYKCYIEPPGTLKRIQLLKDKLSDTDKEEGRYDEVKEEFMYPISPPVKLYTQHADNDQIALLNGIIKQQQAELKS